MKLWCYCMKLLCIIALPLLFVGCATRLGDMSVISSRNVTLDRVDLDSLPQVENVTGKDSKFIFIIIPFGLPHLENAIDDALNKGDGDVMIDAVIRNRSWWFIIGQTAIEVEGTVVKTRGVEHAKKQ